MNEIKKLIVSNEIQFVLFDMDRTLVDTKVYFAEEMTNAILIIVSDIFKSLPLRKQLKITRDILNITNEVYRSGSGPMLVDALSLEGISKYCKDNNIKISDEKVLNKLQSLYKDFYTSSPQLFPYTVESLFKLAKYTINMGVYSHAQDGWTYTKVEKIKREYGQRYNKELELPFFTTDINDSKDKLGWINAGRHFKLDLNKTLVIGDSLTSDIYPAIEAGYKYCVYLTHTDKRVKVENSNEEATIFVKKNISKLLN